MGSSSKRQQTMAKRAREQAVKLRRTLKQEKKQAATAARRQDADEPGPQSPRETDAAGSSAPSADVPAAQ
jgi:hypothetical protein